jgi:AraC-like DNA-binding protein
MSSKKKTKKPRELKMEAQFTFEELYISPLREERCYKVVSRGSEKPQVIEKYVKRNQPGVQTTGIRIMDELISYLAEGRSDMSAFSKERGLRVSDIDSLVFMLTGMSGKEFRQRYQVRMMDELLRYTSLSPAEVGRRSGIGSANNLYLITKREFGEAPIEHRRHIRQPGDEGRYR